MCGIAGIVNRRTGIEQPSRDALALMAGALQHRIKTLIGISSTVSVGAPDSIERTLVGKARRVIDKRPK